MRVNIICSLLKCWTKITIQETTCTATLDWNTLKPLSPVTSTFFSCSSNASSILATDALFSWAACSCLGCASAMLLTMFVTDDVTYEKKKMFSNAVVTHSRKSVSRKSHIRHLSRSWVWRPDVAISWQIRVLRGWNGRRPCLARFREIRLARLLRDRCAWRCDSGIK